jgi:two-component system, LytTR family, response regulator
VTTRVVIADDEAPARRIVRAYLAGHDGVEIVAEAGNGLEVVDAVRSLDPDLVVLDIQMPGMNGFEVIDAIGVNAMPPVVFATAYDEFALRAFDVHAVDYLLKPFTRERFDRAFDRAIARAEPDTLPRLMASLPRASDYLERVVVRKGDRVFFVAASDMLYLTSESNYVRIHTERGSHLVRGTLGDLEMRLDPKRFARIHRSCLVNVSAIKELRAHFHGDYVVVLNNGDTVRLSRRYQARLLGES